MATGLELRLRRGDDPPPGPALGLELRDVRFGVPGGVTPFPLARLSPIAFTRSFTDTPTNSGGRSLQANHKQFIALTTLCHTHNFVSTLTVHSNTTHITTCTALDYRCVRLNVIHT